MVLDIDRFEEVNNSKGCHSVFSNSLQKQSNTLTSAYTRGADTVLQTLSPATMV